MTFLGQLICRAMGVNCYYSFRRNYMNGQKQNTSHFMVRMRRPEIAAYALDVLSRQMVKARRTSISSAWVLSLPTKTARADQFCGGWS